MQMPKELVIQVSKYSFVFLPELLVHFHVTKMLSVDKTQLKRVWTKKKVFQLLELKNLDLGTGFGQHSV